MRKWPDDDVILFDGVCIFCSRWVRFVATVSYTHLTLPTIYSV